MFKKLQDKLLKTLEAQVKVQADDVIAQMGREFRESCETLTQNAKAEVDTRKTRILEEAAAATTFYDAKTREIRNLTEQLDEKRRTLVHETERLEAEIRTMRAGTPDRLYESAFNSGFSKGFDFALNLQTKEFQKHLASRIAETSERERVRYDAALNKLEAKNA